MRWGSYRVRLPGLLAAGALVLTAGCDGREPQQNTTSLAPEVARLLDDVNSLARETVAEREFRYALSPDCTLTAQRIVAGRPAQHWRVPLGATHFVRFEYAPGLGYGLRVPVDGAGTMQSIFDAYSMDRIRQMEARLGSLGATCARMTERAQADPTVAARP